MTPGWHLLQGAQGKGMLPGGGSYVTALSPDGKDFTLILETLKGACLRCSTGATAAQNLTFTLGAGLPAPGTALKAWLTVQGAPFVAQPDVTVGAGGTLSAAIPADAMLTLSTIATASHGAFPDAPIPADAPFPLPYASDFAAQGEDAMPRYFADQAGSFAVRSGVVQQVVGADPGPNGWVANRDPVTFIGDAAWTDVSARVGVSFSAGPPAGQPAAVAGGDGEPAGVAPCSPPAAAAAAGQSWRFSAIAPGYLSTADSTPARSQCLNAPGCSLTDALIYYSCVTTGCSCGCPTFTNLQWAWDAATGALTTGMDASKCVTLEAGSGALRLLPCAPAATPGQAWGYNASSGQVSVAGPGAGGCLTAPPPPAPPPAYAALTLRMATYSRSTPGYQLVADAAGQWRLLKGMTQVLGNGSLGQGFNASQWHTLGLAAKGSTLTGSLDGAQLFALSDAEYSAGQVGIGSGYHQAAFKDFVVEAA